MWKRDGRMLLYDLLQDVFDVNGLLVFVERYIGRGLSSHLPGPNSPLSAVALEIVKLLESRDLVDETLLIRLAGLYPQRRPEIDRIAASLDIKLPDSIPRLYLRHPDVDGRGVRRVFISYSREDYKWAEAVRAALEHVSIDVFMDTTRIRPGDDFPELLLDEVRSRDRVILGWSRAAAASVWVRREYQEALRIIEQEQAQRFLSIDRLDETPLPDELASLHATRSGWYATATDRDDLLAGIQTEDRRAILRIIDRLKQASP